jgi:methionine synthase I (cobalamin-dependent)
VNRTEFIKQIKEKVLLFDGGNGTEFYNRGIFINRCFDELNLSNPSLVKQVHEDYKKAGADIIETNTFGANRFKLKTYQLADKLYEINYQGAKIAREVADGDILVAGAIGPLNVQIEPLGPISREEAREYFREQAQPLIDGSVDLFIFETFILSAEIIEAVKAIREICDLPIIAQMTIKEDTTSLTGAKPEIMIKKLEAAGADVIGANCSVGPQVMLNWLEQVRNHTRLPISVMPNAGKPRSIEGRNIYLASPEYLGEYAKHYIQAGANIIGGCCGTGPDHIKRMRNAINALKPGHKKK